MPKILIVEDDPQIAKSLNINLKLSGNSVAMAPSLSAARKELSDSEFDLICLDIGLPDGSGLDFCQELRERGEKTPILFLSALVDEATVVKGMNLGADDYLRKPFGVEELKVRMKKIISRFERKVEPLCVGPLVIDPVERFVKVSGNLINLGRKEIDILLLLAKRAGNLVTRETIISSVYDHDDLFDRTIDSHMSHLRRKIKGAAGDCLQIVSVYGQGYRLQWE